LILTAEQKAINLPHLAFWLTNLLKSSIA